MDFKQLQSFVTVVESQSFTRAAEQLFVSQPTISAHIHALEEELQTPLLIRTTKNIEVTQKGRQVYLHALEILKTRERMIQTCAGEEKQIIRIGASTIPASYMLPQILPEYGQSCPQTYFSILRSESGAVLQGVAQGRFDLGFSTSQGDETLISQPLCRDRMILIAPVSDYYLQLYEKKEASLEALLAHPVILREKSGAGKKQADRYLSEMGIDEESLEVIARANDQETVKNLVAAGMGVSLISQRAARNFIEEKRVLCFELPVKSEKTIYLVARKTQWHNANIQRFVRYVQRKYTHEQG